MFCILTNFGQSVILCPFKPQMWHAYEDVFYVFWLGCVAFVVATMVYSFFFLHVSTLWFFILQLMQCLLVFHVLLCVFVGTTCLILCGINNAFLVFVVIIPSSHNIAAYLCYCSVDCFIHVVTILRYDCKLALNTIVRILIVVSLINHKLASKSTHSKPPFF
jgi:hypothetical protein